MQRFENTIEILYQLSIPETHDMNALAFQKARPSGIIAPVIGVLTSVELDDKLQWRAIEVGDVGTDRVLAPERKSFHLCTAQARPKFLLDHRCVYPQLARALGFHGCS